MCKKYPVRHNEKEKITGNESIVFFFFTLRDLFRSRYFFSHPSLKELIKNRLCKSSFTLSPVLICQFALSVVGRFPCLLFRTQFSVGIFAGCQSTFVLCLASQSGAWPVVGLSGVSHQVVASWQHCLSSFLLQPGLLARLQLSLSSLTTYNL